MGKKTKASLRITAEPKDVDENIVYVYNSKQSTNVPSLSPWCVALETYVRFIKGEYKVIITLTLTSFILTDNLFILISLITVLTTCSLTQLVEKNLATQLVYLYVFL